MRLIEMDNSNKSVSKPIPIDSLTGLKVIAVLAVYYWHGSCPKLPMDMGARACETLFLISGFLVGYNYLDSGMPANLKQSFKYVFGKLKKYWPLHIITLFWAGLISDKYGLNPDTFIKAIINCFLFQSWSSSSDIFFSFNGVSWFFSSLLFCYFLSPFLIKITQRIKWHIPAFFIAFSARHLFEYAIDKSIVTNVSVHVFPPIRCLEFFLGMLLVPIFNKLSEIIKNRDCFFSLSLLEIFVVVYSVYIKIIFNGHWMRSQFVLISSFLVFVVALNKGIISKTLSLKPFLLFSKIQFEFYMLHQVVIKTIFSVLQFKVGQFALNSITITAIIILSITYHYMLNKVLNRKKQKDLLISSPSDKP